MNFAERGFKYKILAILITILIYLPKINFPTGDDGFYVIWQAKLLLSGNTKWLVSPFSYFGIYTSSGYPYGGILVYAFFKSIFKDLFITIYLVNLFWTILLVLGVYSLLNQFELNDIDKLWLSLIYSSTPIIMYSFSFTTSVRMMFIAIIPYIITSTLKILHEFTYKNLFVFLGLNIIANFFHRIAMLFFGVVIVSLIISKILTNHKFNQTSQNNLKFLIPILITTLTLISIFTFKLDPSQITSPWFSNSTIVGGLINLIIDYILRFGVLILLFVFCYSKLNFNDASIRFGLISLTLLTTIITFSWYVGFLSSIFLFLLIVQTYYKTKNFKPLRFLSLVFILINLIYVLGYSFLIKLFNPFLLIGIIFFLLFLLIINVKSRIFQNKPKTYKFVFLNRNFNHKTVLIIFIILNSIVFSVFNNTTLLYGANSNFPYFYLNSEQIQLARFFEQNNQSFNLAYSRVLEQRMSAINGKPMFGDSRGVALLTSSIISPENLTRSSYFDPLHPLKQAPYLFTSKYFDFLHDKWIDLFVNTNKTIIVSILKQFSLNFVITGKTSYYWGYDKPKFSPFIALILNQTLNRNLVLETEHTLVWQLKYN